MQYYWSVQGYINVGLASYFSHVSFAEEIRQTMLQNIDLNKIWSRQNVEETNSKVHMRRVKLDSYEELVALALW